ncbi:DUF2886 domain containing protein [Sulfitobacter noctilucae]|uniref:YjbF family lipoprotein n=1 Tax=Sulfitobacter noctilucae TaxID=1342302 RepID=UPI00046AC7A9|nr:YjbF family lipoprotein [Sulfitobacter noctilucae]KIN60111.1 DUF2886 domain containing protein [Sulfitobacter noctilucae]
MKWSLSIAFGAALALGACGEQSFQDRALNVLLDEPVGPSYDGQFPRFRPLLQAGGGPALQVTITSSGIQGGFLRESGRGSIETWLGTDGVALTFDRGVLHGTRGVGAGMLASDVSASASAILAGRSGQVERVHTFLTGNNTTDTRAYICTIENQGSETIQLHNGATRTRRMVETCNNLDQSFTNTYWVDTSRGRIAQSRQWSGELFGEFQIKTVHNY